MPVRNERANVVIFCDLTKPTGSIISLFFSKSSLKRIRKPANMTETRASSSHKGSYPAPDQS